VTVVAKARGPALPLIVVVLVALAAAGPLLGPGMVNTRGGGDSPFLLQRTHQLVESLRAGALPARWMPDAAYGFGFPFFSYYSALPFYMAAALTLAGMDILLALRFVQTVGFLVSGIAMYGWVRRACGNPWAASLAGAAYAVAPFHLVNVYVRGDSLSEFFAFAFYPLVLWGLEGLLDGRAEEVHIARARMTVTGAWVWPGLAYAGLVATHNISALIFSPFVLLYLLAMLFRRPDRRRYVLVTGALAVVFGLMISAWVWLPALTETDLVQSQTLTDDYFHYARHFRAFDLVQRSMLFSYSTAPGRDSPFAMGLPQAMLGLAGALALLGTAVSRHSRLPEHRTGRSTILFLLSGLTISTLMITPGSRLVWDSLPLLPLIQFPWRFLSVQSLFVAAATSALVPARRAGVVVALGLAAVLAVGVLVPLRPERLHIGADDVTVERLHLYELFTQNIGTTIRYEWLPRDAVPRPFTSDALVEPGALLGAVSLEDGTVSASLLERGPVCQEWSTEGDGGWTLFPVYYWPGWSATVDGHRVPIEPAQGSGLISLEVPPGDHVVALRLRRTPVRRFADILSAVATIAIVISIGATCRMVRWRRVVAALGSAAVPAAMVLLLPAGVRTDTSALTMDFDRMPYLHHNPSGVAFGDGLRLESYALGDDELLPGDRLPVDLEWSVPHGVYTATLRLLSPAATRREVAPLSEASGRITGGTGRWDLRVPRVVARGIYLVELQVFGPEGEVRALTPAGRTRGRLYLAPVRVPHGPTVTADAATLARFGPAIQLHAASVAPGPGDWLDVYLEWSARYAPVANYGISLRLLDSTGSVVQALDTQPGYGYTPTSMWRAGELVPDRYLVPMPDPGTGCARCSLNVILYQVASGVPIGEARFGEFALPMESRFAASAPPRSFSLPAVGRRSGVIFGDEVMLVSYDLGRSADAVVLSIWWQALVAPNEDYTVFVHLFDPDSEQVLAQSDAMPRNGRYPTSWWAPGEVVSETVTLSTEALPAGSYRLAVGLYDSTVTRLAAVGPGGEAFPDDRVVPPVEIEVEP
jgi:hypothetical protein